jgi:hypothetical protein
MGIKAVRPSLYSDPRISEHLSLASIEALCSGESQALVLDKFASPVECHQLANAVNFVGGSSEGLGALQRAHGVEHKDQYFKHARNMALVIEEVTAASWDPLLRFKALFEILTGRSVEAAREVDGNLFYVGSFRKVEEEIPVHVDFAPLEAIGWSVADAKHQLAFDFVIRAPQEGGDIVVFDKEWSPRDTAFRNPESRYAYFDEIVADAEHVSLQPRPGQAFLYNSRHFHKVEESPKGRLSYGFSIGVMPNGKFWIWS